MSLPNYLANIKSSGVYRFVWDKSEVPPQAAETLRLLIGYSEKGPFNAPVYVESVSDFITIFGNISKKLERKGVYFHRMAIQALQAGPILALNLKKFTDEDEVKYFSVNASNFNGKTAISSQEVGIKTIFDTNRFWSLDPDKMVENLGDSAKSYITVAATDSIDNSCTMYVRKYVPESYNGITLRTWFASQSIEVPEYASPILDQSMSDYFAEVYVFRGDVKGVTDFRDKYIDASGAENQNYTDSFGKPADALEAMAQDSRSNFIGTYRGILLPYFKDANGNYISLDLKFNMDNNKHKMLMKLNESKLYEKTTDTEIIPMIAMDIDENENPLPAQPIYLTGYTISATSETDIYANCIDVIKESGIRTALTNRVDVDYHYIVDTFDSSVVSEGDLGEDIVINCKNELFQLAKDKDNAFAIVNFPKMKHMTVDGSFDAFKTQMPSEVDGASWGAYYTQLTFSDGTVKTVAPSAALVSNLFMDKWGARQPYYIVAGPTYGKITYRGLVGPDYNFGRSDLDVLEPMGVNAIVYVPRRGTYINSNQTAKQIPVSGLSKVHIRELVIYLQDEIENLLQSYQWELNTQTLRDTIKSKADAICETIMNNGGVYAYRNVCDETNNTPEVIDNEMIILDTEIEPARGAGKMVHQLTIHKTGGLTSTVK